MSKKMSDGSRCLYDYLKLNIVASMDSLKVAIGNMSTITIRRKLKEFKYISSCSHSGKYYCLATKPAYGADGLWFHDSVLFSSHGSLLSTIIHLIDDSDDGYTALELKEKLNMAPNECLVKLTHTNVISRKKIKSIYVYFSINKKKSCRQLMIRNDKDIQRSPSCDKSKASSDELKAYIILFYSLLDEKQRRIYAGLESIKCGAGGDAFISELLGLNIKTVSKGRMGLIDDNIENDSVRKCGAGRYPVKKKRQK
jgi:hypothetical protein